MEALFLLFVGFTRNTTTAMACLTIAVGFSGFAISGITHFLFRIFGSPDYCNFETHKKMLHVYLIRNRVRYYKIYDIMFASDSFVNNQLSSSC